MIKIHQLIFLSLLVSFSTAAPEEDLVTWLPYMGNFTFPMYSGYLNISGSNSTLHYIFAQSQKNPTNDPLLFWFNGGPGCSSLLGFLQEHGPYVMDDETNYFYYNNNSWNLEANVVYIEMPAGVGFSKCGSNDSCNYTDETSARENLMASLDFFEKFPEFAAHDLYLTGESYAGIYVPYLALMMDSWNANATLTGDYMFNLKGFLVGNGVTNWKWDGD